MISVRPCETGDLERVVAILEARREEYARYEPVFWKRKHGTGPASAEFLKGHVENERAVSLVAVEGEHDEARVVGFLFALEMRVPPVYDAGPTALIDDFHMARPELWETAGVALLEEAKARLRDMGLQQIVVVSGYADHAKMVFARRQGLSLASAWLTAAL